MFILAGTFAIVENNLGGVTIGIPFNKDRIYPLMSFPSKDTFTKFVAGLVTYCDNSYNVPDIFIDAFKEEERNGD